MCVQSQATKTESRDSQQMAGRRAYSGTQGSLVSTQGSVVSTLVSTWTEGRVDHVDTKNAIRGPELHITPLGLLVESNSPVVGWYSAAASLVLPAFSSSVQPLYSVSTDWRSGLTVGSTVCVLLTSGLWRRGKVVGLRRSREGSSTRSVLPQY